MIIKRCQENVGRCSRTSPDGQRFAHDYHPLLKVVVQSSVYSSEQLTQEDSPEIN